LTCAGSTSVSGVVDDPDRERPLSADLGRGAGDACGGTDSVGCPAVRVAFVGGGGSGSTGGEVPGEFGAGSEWPQMDVRVAADEHEVAVALFDGPVESQFGMFPILLTPV
jgi:hypothetical protein